MKKSYLSKIICGALTVIFMSGLSLPAQAHEEDHKEDHKKNHKKDQAIEIKDVGTIGNMAHVTSVHDRIFMAGQPDQETLKSLKDKGFDIVLNIRGTDEVKFDEKGLVEQNGLEYFNIPLLKDGKIQDDAVTKIHDVIKNSKGKKILFHCSSGNRVASWLGAHLVRDMKYDKDSAITLAKQAGMTHAGMETVLNNYLAQLSE